MGLDFNAEERKVSARELLGTAFPDREVKYVPQEKIAIHVFSIGPNRQRENLTGGQPIEGYLDLDDLEKQFGVGRYLLVAKNKDNGVIITQAMQDVVRQTPHPMAIIEETKSDEVGVDSDKFTEALDLIMQRIDGIEQRVERPPKPELDMAGGTLTEKLLMRMLDDKADEKKNFADQMAMIMKNALEVQKDAIKAASAFEIEEKRDSLAVRQKERERRWEREDMEFEAKTRLIAQRMQQVSGVAVIDPEGGNAMSLVEAIKDIIGNDNSFKIFGFDLSNLLEPIVPQLAKALEDRGLYIVAKNQMEMIINSQFERGRIQGQDEALTELVGPGDEAPTTETTAETKDGPDGGQGDAKPSNDPGPDNREGGPAGS